MSTVHISEHT